MRLSLPLATLAAAPLLLAFAAPAQTYPPLPAATSQVSLNDFLLSAQEEMSGGNPKVTPTLLPLSKFHYSTTRYTQNADGDATWYHGAATGDRHLAYSIPPGCTSVTFTVTPKVSNTAGYDGTQTTTATVVSSSGKTLAAVTQNLALPRGQQKPLTGSPALATWSPAGAQDVVTLTVGSKTPTPSWVDFTVAANGVCSALPTTEQVKLEVLSATIKGKGVKVRARATAAYTDGEIRALPVNTLVKFARTWVPVGEDGIIEVTTTGSTWTSNFAWRGSKSSSIKCVSGRKCTW